MISRHIPLNFMNRKLWNVVSENDRMIYELATYYETNGFMRQSVPEKILARFAEFKKRVLIGSITLDKLQLDVFKKFGVTEGVQYVSAPVEALPEDIQRMVEELSEEVEE